MRNSTIGGSLVMIAIGAILAFAVSIETEGFNINTAGLILMGVGVIGLVLSVAMGATPEKTVVDSKHEEVHVNR